MRRRELPDVSGRIGIGSRASWAVWGTFAVTETTFATVSLRDSGAPALVALALAVMLAGSALLLRKAPDPFPLRWSLLVIVAVLVQSGLTLVGLPQQGWPGFAAWYIGASTWMLFILALRGRLLMAWLGYLGLTSLTATWSLIVGRPLTDLIGLHSKEAGLLLVGTLFTLSLRVVARRTEAYQATVLARAAESAGLESARDARARRVAELSVIAAPVLRRIASGGELDDETRRECLIVEARLRDGLRARSLYTPVIIEVVEAARRRGVTVTLMDDRGEAHLEETTIAAIETQIVGVLSGMASGTATVRLRPATQDAAVSIVCATDDTTVRIDLDHTGRRVESAPAMAQ